MPLILIVEDDPQVRALLQETLQAEGYATAAAENGHQAMKLLETCSPDAVITDILMPEKEGLSLITELRKRNKDVCIVAISGGAEQLSPSCNLELARMFGATLTFQKPLDIDTLLESLARKLPS